MASRTLTLAWLLSVCAGAVHAAPPKSDPKGLEFFENKIRPVLIAKCYSCHSAHSEKLKGDLLVDSRAGLLKGGVSKKPTIHPGEPEKSPLIKAVRGDDADELMPPKGDALTPQEVADFVAWVKMGAPDPRTTETKSPYSQPAADSAEARAFWSFKPVADVPVPNSGSAAKFAHPIDKFLATKQDEKGVAPLAAADKRTLIRRATFDLTGLPPTPEEVEAFVADISPNAFEKLIDRLLATTAYGERWGRHWLDVVRYADTAGESADYPVPQAYLYRNYVIDSFNRDKPYDRFLTEQIAGDLLPHADSEDKEDHLVATGFLAISRRFSVAPENVMHLTYEDALDTVGKGVLGLSLSCARCHDHKFDPIPTADYYALYGILSSTKWPFPGSENTKFQKDMVVLSASDEQAAQVQAFNDKVSALDREYNRLKREERRQSDSAAKKQARAQMDKAKAELDKIRAQAPNVPSAYAVQEKPADEQGDAKVQNRGEPGNPGPTVRRGFLTVLGGQKLPDGHKGSGRLELAKWLTDPANPLTARVMVNRIWQGHFGRGLVTTPSDFGKRGAAPTHPELLDYLSKRFADGKWSIKAMHRLIMTSAAYRRSSADDVALATKDAGNTLYWQYDRRRLDAEEIRDAFLFVSTDLDRTVGGAHPFPPMGKWGWTQHAPFAAVYDSKLRSVYLMQQRIKKHPFLAMFDGADTNTSTAERTESTTPLQALYMMNDKFVHEQSERLAARLMAERADATSRAARAIELAFARPATPEETAAAVAFVDRYRAKLAGSNVSAAEYEKASLAAYVRALLCSNEFFYLD
ncbi:MAG TPA: PSD1 and planctomycete cytochrome C domain-containing protein [Tepidisphaeraceae bacterium]|nr:PSD1 and planctomycete cytochrome C domain-containing protein [Tepidisphaeraceae bacterium]